MCAVGILLDLSANMERFTENHLVNYITYLATTPYTLNDIKLSLMQYFAREALRLVKIN